MQTKIRPYIRQIICPHVRSPQLSTYQAQFEGMLPETLEPLSKTPPSCQVTSTSDPVTPVFMSAVPAPSFFFCLSGLFLRFQL